MFRSGQCCDEPIFFIKKFSAKYVNLSFVDSLFIVVIGVFCFCVWSLLCNMARVQIVRSSFAIISLVKRQCVALRGGFNM